MYSRFPVQYAELLCLLLPMHTVLGVKKAKKAEPGVLRPTPEITNFRDHDAPDRLRDTKACQKESFYVIICII